MNSCIPALSESVKRERSTPRFRARRLLFASCSFVSAFLLFQVQLIVSKCILPWFGGSAAVWTTAMLVFQVLLLAGYLYSHLLVLRQSPRAQSRTHIGLLGAGFLAVLALSFVWPSAVTPGAAWRSVAGGNPALGVAYSILAAAGLPFFILSTTGPLLQSWFARLGGGAESYRLYAISNVGSLLGLVSYPLAVEPALRIAHQGQMWAALFCAFAIAGMACAWLASEAEQSRPGVCDATEKPRSVNWFFRALWFLLPACGSGLLLSSTNKICQEVATIPLLWVVPLALYLLSFILCFDHPRWYQRAVFHPVFAISLLTTCFALHSDSSLNVLAELVCIPVVLFTGCMICHGELSLLKPDSRQLTSFYLAISAGGAAGGIFVALIAPKLFTSFVEFQLSLGMAVVLMLLSVAIDKHSWFYRSSFWLPAAITVGTIVTVFAIAKVVPEAAELLDNIHFYPMALLLGAIAVTGALTWNRAKIAQRSPFRPLHVLVACEAVFVCFVVYTSAQPPANLILSRRNFYGVMRVIRQPASNQLIHGTTVHGEQLDPPFDSFPTTYYGSQSGIGVLLRNHPRRKMGQGSLRIGIVGLGAGTLAAYGHPGDSIRYYEIDPNVVSVSAGAKPVFTYLHSSQAQISLALGDARLMLEKEPPSANAKYDVLVLDAFSGDAIPVHLLTKEAFDSYWERVDPEYGVIAVHASSRHVNLSPVVQGVSRQFGTDILTAYNPGGFSQGPVFESEWILLSRRRILRGIPELSSLEVGAIDKTPPVLWTDDYSNVFRLLHLSFRLRELAN